MHAGFLDLQLLRGRAAMAITILVLLGRLNRMTVPVLRIVFYACGLLLAACVQNSDRACDCLRENLPFVACEIIPPLKDSSSFALRAGAYVYVGSAYGGGPPLDSDEVAVRAARGWIEANFGALTPDSPLMVQRVVNGAAGVEEGASAKGYTVVFRQLFRGIQTPFVSIVYIVGRGGFSGRVCIAQFTELMSTRSQILSAERALSCAREFCIANGGNGSEVARDSAHLAYSRVKYLSELKMVIGPVWKFGYERPVVVDAHKGEVWIDD